MFCFYLSIMFFMRFVFMCLCVCGLVWLSVLFRGLVFNEREGDTLISFLLFQKWKRENVVLWLILVILIISHRVIFSFAFSWRFHQTDEQKKRIDRKTFMTSAFIRKCMQVIVSQNELPTVHDPYSPYNCLARADTLVAEIVVNSCSAISRFRSIHLSQNKWPKSFQGKPMFFPICLSRSSSHFLFIFKATFIWFWNIFVTLNHSSLVKSFRFARALMSNG